MIRIIEDPSKKTNTPEKEIPTETKIAEKSAPGPLSEIPQKKGFWEKLGEKTKEKLTAIYEKSGTADTVDRAKVVFNRTIMKLHTDDAIIYKKRLGDRNQSIEVMQKTHDDYGSSVKRMREMGIPVDTAKLEKEKMELVEKIDKEKKRADKIQSKLEAKNLKREMYENRVKDVCENAKERIDRHLNPYEQKVGELKLKRENLKSEIESFKETKGRFESRIKELENAAKSAVWKEEKKAFESKIKEMNDALKKADKSIKSRANDRMKIDKKIISTEKKASPWRDKRNEFARFTKIESPNISVPGKKTEEFAGKTEKDKADKKEENLEDKETKFDPSKLINLWNKHFGSELAITPQILNKLTIFPAKRMTADYFLRNAELYDRNIHGKKGSKNFRENALMFKKIVDRHAEEM